MTAVPDLETIRAGVTARPPTIAPPIDGVKHAAVAIVVAPGPRGPELLFIERARHPDDHWSGDMAFPGGRRDPGDPDIADTARRETLEETGVALGPPTARLDDYDARSGRRPWPLVVSPFVHLVDRRPETTPNHEVETIVWIPLADVLDPRRVTRHRFPRAGTRVVVPALRHERFVIWGMTHRMLGSFTASFGRPLPE